MDHDLAYRALASGGADVDRRLHDRRRDPRLRAARARRRPPASSRATTPCCSTAPICATRAPAVPSRRSSAWKAASTTPTMIALNARAKLDRVPRARSPPTSSTAHVGGGRRAPPREHALARSRRRAAEHRALVALSLLAAIAVAVPLGILAARRPRIGPRRRRRRRPAADHPVAGAARVPDPAARHRLAARASRRCSSTACCRSCATRTPAWSASPSRCAMSARALGLPRAARACAWSSCRWRCRPSSPASRRRR